MWYILRDKPKDCVEGSRIATHTHAGYYGVYWAALVRQDIAISDAWGTMPAAPASEGSSSSGTKYVCEALSYKPPTTACGTQYPGHFCATEDGAPLHIGT